MLWQQAMMSKGFQEKCPQEQDLHCLRHRIEGWQWLSTALNTKFEDLCLCMEAWVTFDFQTTGQVLGLSKPLLPGILAGIQTVAHILKLLQSLTDPLVIQSLAWDLQHFRVTGRHCQVILGCSALAHSRPCALQQAQIPPLELGSLVARFQRVRLIPIEVYHVFLLGQVLFNSKKLIRISYHFEHGGHLESGSKTSSFIDNFFFNFQRLVPSTDPLASLVSLPSLDQILILLWEMRQGLVELQDLLGFLWVRLLQGISKVGLVFLIHIGLLLLDCGLGRKLRLSILAHVCRSWSLGAVYCDPCSGCNQEMSQLISSCKSLASENESAKTVACPGPRKKEKAREKGKW